MKYKMNHALICKCDRIVVIFESLNTKHQLLRIKVINYKQKTTVAGAKVEATIGWCLMN